VAIENVLRLGRFIHGVLSKNSWKHHLWFVAVGLVLVDRADCVQLD